MDESFRAFAIVKAARGSVGAKAGQRGQVEHASQSAVVAFRATQVTGDSSGILWHRDQSGIGGQAPGGGEIRQVAAGERWTSSFASAVATFLEHPRIAVRVTEIGATGIVGSTRVEAREEAAAPAAVGVFVADFADSYTAAG